MKIFIDWLKKAITKIEHDSELYVGNQFSNKFDVYFFNVGTDTDWFPTLTQLAPNGREAGPFSPDSDSFTTTTIDNVTYLTATFTMGTGYAFIKGVSSFFLYENRITTPHQTKSVIGKFIVTLNNSDNGYFIDDPEFNPKVKEYVDKYSQLRFGGEASTSVIEVLTSNQGVWLATDTGYYWYWDYDNNEYVRGNLFQAVSVADGAITKQKLASAVRNEINNKVNNGENNPTYNSNVHTNIFNSNSQESDTDESYGSEIDLSLDKGIIGHSFSSDSGISRHSKIEFDEYHDNTTNEDYPRAVIEAENSVNATTERSKIAILKDLIGLISGGKITLQATNDIEIKKGDSYFKIYKNSSNKDVTQIYSKNNVNIDGKEWAHLGTNGYEINVLENSGFYLTILNDTVFFCNRTGFKSNVPLYYNNKELSTKEYVDQQIDIIEASGLQASDIADNLTTNDSTKVLSAAQGVVLKQLIDNINTLLQCDDTTLDEIQEIVDYIKNNKSLIDGITTSKVSVSDIINNLTTTATNKPLSANQGKILKGLIDGLQTAINGIKNGTNINSFGAVETALNSLDGRVAELEENPTSNVSGTNDGTNWTSITIGNDTYAIPSGSSSGSSGSGETLKIIEITNAFTNADTLIVGITSSKWASLLSLLSQGMGITITEDNIQTVWTNASDYEKMTFIKYIFLPRVFAQFGVITVLTANATETTVDGVDIVTSIDLIGGGTGSSPNYSNNVCASNLSDMSGASITITTIGGGNGGDGASASQSFKKIKLHTSHTFEESGVTDTLNDYYTYIIPDTYYSYIIAIANTLLQSSYTTLDELFTALNTTLGSGTSDSQTIQLYKKLMQLLSKCTPFNIDVAYQYVDTYDTPIVGDSGYFSEIRVSSGGVVEPTRADTKLSITVGTVYQIEYSDYSFGSGGSSASESYYKIVLSDSNAIDNRIYSTTLTIIENKQDFNDLLTAINTQMGTSLSTPQDLINAYDNMKGDSNYYSMLATAFTILVTNSFDRNLNVALSFENFTKQKVTAVYEFNVQLGIGDELFNNPTTLPNQIAFTSSSTLTITEQTNQKI